MSLYLCLYAHFTFLYTYLEWILRIFFHKLIISLLGSRDLIKGLYLLLSLLFEVLDSFETVVFVIAEQCTMRTYAFFVRNADDIHMDLV